MLIHCMSPTTDPKYVITWAFPFSANALVLKVSYGAHEINLGIKRQSSYIMLVLISGREVTSLYSSSTRIHWK